MELALLKLFDTVFTVYTIPTALHCLKSGMHAYIFCFKGKGRALLELADALLSKLLDLMEWVMEWIHLRLL